MATAPPNIPLELTVDELRLRAWRVDDGRALRDALDRNDAHLRPWIPFMRHEPRSLEETRARVAQFRDELLRGSHIRYAVWCDEHLAGEVMLIDRDRTDEREVGYWLDAGHQRRGIARRATSALVSLGFEALGLQRVWFHVDVRNAASNGLPPALGAHLVDTVSEDEVRLNVWRLERPG